MKKNLSDILHEGLLDSVLPYMLPKPVFSQPIIKKPITSVEPKKTASLGASHEGRAAPSANRDKDKDKNKPQRKPTEWAWALTLLMLYRKDAFRNKKDRIT